MRDCRQSGNMKLFDILNFSLHVLVVQGSVASKLSNSGVDKPGERPSIDVRPKTLDYHLPHKSPSRTKVCIVNGGTNDDSNAILEAFKKCNNGGHVLLKSGTTYTIGQPLDLRFLKHVDWGIVSPCLAWLWD